MEAQKVNEAKTSAAIVPRCQNCTEPCSELVSDELGDNCPACRGWLIELLSDEEYFL
jgi:Zn finger protein HypA/HybF involved in hydrogenase expression